MSAAAESKAPPVAPGTILAGKYRVERVIGEGGMGVVVEARHIALDDRVALKFLTAAYAQHPEAAARFHREAKAAARIKSEHVARVSDVGTLDDGAPYMVMEFLQGNDLLKELQTRGVLPLEDAVDYVIQASDAIAEAHAAGIIHRDLKPANLFLTRRLDGSPLVKVLDFGISKMSEGTDNLTKTMTAMGSALYMSPEQMQQTRGVDHRTDIYALGVALYELLAGKQPYYADTLPQLCAEVLTGTPTPLRTARPDLPQELAAVLEKAYARDRTERYSTIGHFVIALAPFAPARSQPIIDRVARVVGLTPPIAGMPAAPPVAAAGQLLTEGGTIAMEVPAGPAASPPPRAPFPSRGGTLAVDPHAAGPMRTPTNPALGPAGAPHAAAPYPGAPYAAAPYAPPPQGQGAPPGYGYPAAGPPAALGATGHPAMGPPAALVATGHPAMGPPPPATAPNMEVASPARPPPAGSKAPIFIGVAALLLVGAGAAALVALRSPEAPPSSGSAASAPLSGSAQPTTTAATAEPTATATATATASAEPAVTATATAAATTKPSASAKPTGPAPGTKPTATASTKGTGTATKPRIFNER